MSRHRIHVFSLIFVLISLLAACDSENPPTPTLPSPTVPATAVPDPSPTPVVNEEPSRQTEGVFFSELLPGVPGGNSQEFIELYNAGAEPVDLMGWSVFYLLDEGQEQQLVYRWTETAVIPPHGHVLLVREGQDVGAAADGFFTQSLFERKGGLLLRNKTQQTVDLLGWGSAPAEFTAGEAVAAPDGGASLERLPGGEAGNGQNSGNNAADFAALATPNPQNSGSPITPQPDEFLTIDVSAPEAIAPGSQFVLTVEVGNVSDTAASNVTISLPIASYFELVAVPEGAELANGRLTWTISEIEAKGNQATEITLLSPFTYTDTLLTGYYADADGYLAAFGPPQLISMAGGAIPIATARELVGSVVSVEGIATMYTGGFFAGSGGKFYLQDETGGIQVYMPGEQAQVAVAIGDRVRVTGLIEPYRDSLELIPSDTPTSVELLGEADQPEPLSVTVEDVNNSDAILGELVAIEGTVLAVEDFSFDFQVQIDQGTGETATVLIEKQTGASAELIEVGQNYRMVGISEFYQGLRQVKPRLQSDIVEIVPPIVLLEMQSANTAVPGQVLTYTVTAANYTDQPLTNVFVALEVPGGAANALQVQPDQNGISANGDVIWQVEELSANGGTAVLQYFFTVPDSQTAPLVAPPAQLTANEQAEPVLSNSFTTFLGDTVPIWAIQGEGDRSPYVGIEAATSGVVTAVFPELNGFFIQDLEPDANPATSDGLFVFTGVLPITVQVGDLLEVNGRVRELSGQTALQVESLADVVVNSSGYTNVFEPPVLYDPPQDPAAALAYNESLEGVLVGVLEPALVIAPTTQYGEYALVYEKWGVTAVARTDDSGYLIYVDDGSSTVHDDQDSLPYAVAKGDFVANLVGPLAYTFGNYKIEPIAVPDVAPINRPLPTIRAAAEDELSIATFNVENLFDLVTPHPSSPPIPTVFEYRNKLEKIAQTIVAMGAPTIIGLQEVENVDILQDLVEEEAIAEYGYEPYLIEGNDSRGIDVGYLVRSDRATVQSVAVYDAPGELFARPPLVITVTAHLSSGDQTVIVLNNHFLSLSAGEEATEPVRAAQAAWNITIIEELAAENPEAQFVVLGDLNSFYQTLPVDTLEAGGLEHVYRYLPEEERPYTYIFEGRTQTLDHIVVSLELFDRLVLVQPLHTNADYPVPDPEDTSPRRVSDHDPLVAIFTFSE